MARAAYFISQDKPGKEGKLFVPRELQTDFEKQRQRLSSAARCPGEGRVPPQREPSRAESSDRDVHACDVCVEGTVLRSVLGDSRA